MAWVAQNGLGADCMDKLVRYQQRTHFSDALLIAYKFDAIRIAPSDDPGLGLAQCCQKSCIIGWTNRFGVAYRVDGFRMGRAQCKKVEIGHNPKAVVARPRFDFARGGIAALGVGGRRIFEDDRERRSVNPFGQKSNAQSIAIALAGGECTVKDGTKEWIGQRRKMFVSRKIR